MSTLAKMSDVEIEDCFEEVYSEKALYNDVESYDLDVERTNEGTKVIVHVTSMADNPMPEDYKKNEELKSVTFSFRDVDHCFFMDEVVVVSSIDYDVVYISK